MTTTTKRVGLIGYGLAGRVFHAPLVSAEPTLDLTVVVTRNQDRVAAAHADLPAASIVPHRGRPVRPRRRPRPRRHRLPQQGARPAGARRVERGLPVVVDKPLAATAAEAQRGRRPRRARHLAVRLPEPPVGQRLPTLRSLLGAASSARSGDWSHASSAGARSSRAAGARGATRRRSAACCTTSAPTSSTRRSSSSAPPVRSTPRPNPPTRRGWAAALRRAHPRQTGAVAPVRECDRRALGPRLRVLGARAGYVVDGLDPQEGALRAGQRPGPGWGEVPEQRWGRRYAGGRSRIARFAPCPGSGRCSTRSLPPRSGAMARQPVDPRDAVVSIAVLEAAKESARLGTVIAL